MKTELWFLNPAIEGLYLPHQGLRSGPSRSSGDTIFGQHPMEFDSLLAQQYRQQGRVGQGQPLSAGLVSWSVKSKVQPVVSVSVVG